MTTVSSKIETMNPSFQPFTVLAVDDSAANDSLADAGRMLASSMVHALQDGHGCERQD